MYVTEIKNQSKGKQYKSVLIRESYREDGKVKNRTIANISNLPSDLIASIKSFIKGQKGGFQLSQLKNGNSREYGASFTLKALAKNIGLDKIINSRNAEWSENVMAMIIGRILYQGSKLSLVNQFKDTSLWELAGHEYGVRPDIEKHCYKAMDELLKRKKRIEDKLAKKHLKDGCVVLYDITNTWLEGEYEKSKIVKYGKPKGGKIGYKQVAIGLLTDKYGCPVGVEIFKGNTSDQTTVLDQIKKLSTRHGLKELIFTGDRGMLTAKRVEEIKETDFKIITALTHGEMKSLLEKEKIQQELFDETKITEIIDNEGVRYELCKNESEAKKESETRNSMINKVELLLNQKANVKKKRNPLKVAASIGRIFEKYKIEKFFDWTVKKNGEISWTLKQEKIDNEAETDGCYVIKTTANADIISSEEIVLNYRNLQKVEQAFKNMKTVVLEMRPVYHKNDERIEAHIFIVMLAYYLQWHMMDRLKPLFQADGNGKNKRWSFNTVIERLKSITKIDNLIEGIRVKSNITEPDKEQKEILNFLNINLT